MSTTDSIPPLPSSFAYIAQTFDGQPMTGTIEAANLEDASKRLSNLRLRIIRLDPASPPPRARALRGEDFAAFNQQLAQLASAGLPIEQGLRLIAEDLGHGGLAQSIREVSAELDRGVPLGEAFQKHEKQFPSIYGTLVEAGVRTGNLSAVLFNLGRHVDLVNRLRAAVWQAAAYPVTVFFGLLLIIIFLGHAVVPQFQQFFIDMKTDPPGISKLLFVMAQYVPWLIVTVIAIAIAWPVLWIVLRATRKDQAAADLVLPIPLVGPVLKRNLIARWCDALRIAVVAGMDLPSAVHLAGEIVGSPALRRDGAIVVEQLNQGKEFTELPRRTWVIPPTVLAVMQVAADRNDLPASLESLAVMYQQRAEARLASVQAALTPFLIICVALIIGFVIVGLFAPMISLFQSMTAPVHFH